jgi:hypothetical protein
MGLTCRANTFRCSREQAVFVAECAGLRHIVSSLPYSNSDELYGQYLQYSPRPVEPPLSDDEDDSYDGPEWQEYLRL